MQLRPQEMDATTIGEQARRTWLRFGDQQRASRGTALVSNLMLGEASRGGVMRPTEVAGRVRRTWPDGEDVPSLWKNLCFLLETCICGGFVGYGHDVRLCFLVDGPRTWAESTIF